MAVPSSLSGGAGKQSAQSPHSIDKLRDDALLGARPVTFLRNRLLLVTVSLLIIGGYSHKVLANCDAPARQKMEQQTGKKEQPPSKNGIDRCQCLCHQTISTNPLTPAVLPDPILVAQPAHFASGDAPPDRQPRGIDHPPQLV